MTARIFKAGKLYSTVTKRPAGNAVLVTHGRVTATGNIDDVRARAPHAEIVDFGGATITPGLTDAHIHITEWALARQQVHLDDAGDIEACVAIVKQHVTDAEWMLGRGWNPHRWGGAYPNRQQLDTVVADRPAAFQSHDMHALWVNSAALERAGITSSTADPEGGRVVRDEQGNPTGMLLETAAQLVVSKIPLPDEAQMRTAVTEAQRQLHGYGITGIHSFPGVHLPEPDPLPVLEDLRVRGGLRLRVLQHISAEKLTDAIRLGLRSGFGGEWIRIGAVKMFLDGALGSRTAWMLEPYENSDNRGVQVLERAAFEEIVFTAAQNGIATTVHAIGDAAVALAFDVISRAPRVDALPHRVEHVQCLPAQALPMLRNGIVCSVQPCHLMTDWRAADAHWGARSARTYAFRTITANGAVLACGSDAPVESPDPRLGLYAAVARRDTRHEPENGWQGEECIPAAAALAGYTEGAAVAAGAIDVQGTLRPGAYADFAVWQTDPLACEPATLLDLRIAATAVAGEVVFEA